MDSRKMTFFEAFNPATGKQYAKVSLADAFDGSKAVTLACESLGSWAGMTGDDKKEIFKKAAIILSDKRGEMVNLLTLETGSTRDRAYAEFDQSMALIENTTHSDCLLDGSVPGVNLIFSHWYAPLYFTIKAFVDAIMNSQSMVLNPAMETPVIGLVLGKIFISAGLKKELCSVITGPRDIFSSILPDDNGIQQITITEQGERHWLFPFFPNKKKYVQIAFERVSVVVLEGADVDDAARLVVRLLVTRTQDVRIASGIVLVERTIAASFIQAIVKKVKDLSVPTSTGICVPRVGSLISKEQIHKMHAQINEAIVKGASILAGGGYENCFYTPSIITDVTPAMGIYEDPAIGPVIPIINIASEQEASFYIPVKSHFGNVFIFPDQGKRKEQMVKKLNMHV